MMIYLDNNATTMMARETCAEMVKWCNHGNPSSGYASAAESRKLMSDFRAELARMCGVRACCDEPRDNPAADAARVDPASYKLLFTSGASEANCTALHSVVSAYATTGRTPHVVMSAVEHKSLIATMESFVTRGFATCSWVKPAQSGHILAADVAAAIGPNTCLVCVMHANNETGAINDIAAIGATAHAKGVPYHCDTVQSFGKLAFDPIKCDVDSFCVSFHKLHGPPGVGIWGVKQQLVVGYKLAPIIFGSQNDGMRGGTENVPGIAAAAFALRATVMSRASKNTAIAKLRDHLIAELSRRMPAMTLAEYAADTRKEKPALELVFLRDHKKKYLHGTLLLSVIKRTMPRICNSKMRTYLESKNIIVSIGSACNTASTKASHVLYAMDVDELVRAGTLRISIGERNTLEEINTFAREFLLMLKKITS